MLKVVLLIIGSCQCSIAASIAQLCMNQDTCGGCLAAHLDCAWCTDKQYDIRYRCLTRSLLTQNGCNASAIYVNAPDKKILKQAPLKDYESVDDRAVQVTPQRISLKLVKGHTQQIKLTYRPARNNPLDLYVLMDLTWTMRDDKETLTKLGTELTQTLRNLTANYRLGFGSFADKPAMPMIMPQLQQNPCAAEYDTCEPTYSYRHHLSLTEQINAFVRSVNSSRITGNLDNLEGGLDALMQVIVCPNEIGWKEAARKVVILVSDGFMHMAGDGLLAGITQRNDKRCHLNKDGEYMSALEYDYPSLEEIYRELLKRKISVIFAVTEDVVSTYHEMSALMAEISNVGLLSEDSSNILELLKRSYESLIKRTQFSDNSPDFIKLEYETDCGGQTSTRRKRNYCNNVELGTEVDFYVNITLTGYPPDEQYRHKIRIEESTLNEYMEIEVEIQEPCPCAEHIAPDDDFGRFQCTDNGYLHCGMCKCDDGWTGNFCSCPTESTNTTTNEMLNNMCRQPTNESKDEKELGEICTNRGECECGACYCMPGYDGKYCECIACDEDNCNPEHADCLCGECVCKAGWTGSSCNCPTGTDDCIGPTGEICSQRGTCICGACNCDETYMGHFCEIGDETENKLCVFYEPCVRCLIEQKQGLGICENLTEICSSSERDDRFTYAFVNEDLDADIRCLVRITNKHGIKCDNYFTYRSLGQTQNYLLIQALQCEPVNYVAFMGFVSLATFILGLLIICIFWACVRAKDAREYAKFLEDQRHSYRHDNPIYRDPVRHYDVPKQLSVNYNDNPFL